MARKKKETEQLFLTEVELKEKIHKEEMSKKRTPAQMRKEIENFRYEIEQYKSTIENKDKKIKSLNESAYCYMCNKHKPKSDFYVCYDYRVKSGISRICKQCAYDIANRLDENGEYQGTTIESVQTALEYLDKPWIESVWDCSVGEVKTRKGNATNPWDFYVKNITLPPYNRESGARWRDGDLFKVEFLSSKKQDNDNKSEITYENPSNEISKNEEIESEYKINKKDVVRFCGYDPFQNYPNEMDKPLLYAKLVNLLDEETKNDGQKMNAVIQIVKAVNQAEKLNDRIDMLVNDTQTDYLENIPIIDKLTATIQKLYKTVNDLAKDNGISVNFNNNKSKGANTLSGKVKLFAERGFRSSEINSFDIGTCEGMRQVAEISEAARHKQIGYDENIAQEIKDIKVQLVEKLQKERDEAVEESRKLLRENVDLKEFLQEKGLIDENYNVID